MGNLIWNQMQRGGWEKNDNESYIKENIFNVNKCDKEKKHEYWNNRCKRIFFLVSSLEDILNNIF